MNPHDWINTVDRDILLNILGDFVSAISEDCCYAGWIAGAEYMVPALCVRADKLSRPQRWAHGEVGHGSARVLLAIAARLGHWVNLDEAAATYVPFEPWPTPQKYTDEMARWRKHSRS